MRVFIAKNVIQELAKNHYFVVIVGQRPLALIKNSQIIGVIIGTFSSIFVATPFLKFANVTQKTVNKEEN